MVSVVFQLFSTISRYLLYFVEESLREKYQRLEQLKQQRTLQRLQNHQLTTKNDLLVHLKEQTALHLAVSPLLSFKTCN